LLPAMLWSNSGLSLELVSEMPRAMTGFTGFTRFTG
jgi:hypothetical protein